MRRIVYFSIAVGLGAGPYFLYHRLSDSHEAVLSDEEALRKAEAAPSLDAAESGAGSVAGDLPEPGPILTEPSLTEEAPRPEGGPEAPLIGPAPPPAAPPPSSALDPAPPPAPAPEKLPVATGKARQAEVALESGDTARGVKLLREVFRESRDRSASHPLSGPPEGGGADLVPLARKLVEVEEGDAERLDLYRYLAAHDGDPAWRFRASLGLGTLESKETAPEAMRGAWEHLTRAYLDAPGPAERRQVLAVLDPFVKRNVLSKRFSALVTSHTVKPGESLNRIARSRGTTEDAIQRLNQLADTIIHPGQRLIVLEGKPKIFVKKSQFRLWLMAGERLLMECPVGLGRDNSTPAAVFLVRVRQKDPIWYRQGELPIAAGDPRNILGTRWLGFKDTEDLSGFGIHGTSDPASIGKEESAGCIRMHNRDLELLWDLVPVGTEVEVLD